MADNTYLDWVIQNTKTVWWHDSAEAAELQLGRLYLAGADDPDESKKNQLTRWERYAQALLAGNEFLYID